MNQIQVTPQNIHSIMDSMLQHIASIRDRQESYNDALTKLDEGDIVAAAKVLVQHYLSLTEIELKTVRQQYAELEELRLRVDTGLVLPR